jgi:dihydropteroate synthase
MPLREGSGRWPSILAWGSENHTARLGLEAEVEHNPRVIELSQLPRAIRNMADVDEVQAAAADRAAARARRALRLDAVGPDSADVLRQESQALGILVLEGLPGPEGSAARILVADDETLKRLGAVLESRGERSLGAAIRSALSAYPRTRFVVPYPDGGRLELGVRTAVMGVLNVTPDSFSDGGRHLSPREAVAAAARMAEEGADIVDVGGESTRPGADPVPEEEEGRRVLPVVAAIKRELGVRVSVDTMKAAVARRAIEAGADMINDVSAFSDPGMIPVVREGRVPVVVMHMRGSPRTMQLDTDYVDLLSSVVGFLRKTVERAVAAGISDDKILVDPGLGFGKSAAGNLRILRDLPTLRSVGRPILIGASRKSFIGAVLDLPVSERLEGSLAAAALAAWQGAHVIRAHDVAATVRVVRMVDAIRNA